MIEHGSLDFIKQSQNVSRYVYYILMRDGIIIKTMLIQSVHYMRTMHNSLQCKDNITEKATQVEYHVYRMYRPKYIHTHTHTFFSCCFQSETMLDIPVKKSLSLAIECFIIHLRTHSVNNAMTRAVF